MTTLQRGEFPDFEQFLCDLLNPIAATVPALPQTAAQIVLPLIWVRKTGGVLDVNAITYKAQVQIVVFGTDRLQAQNLAIRVRDAVLCAPAATTTDGVLIDYVEEITSSEPKFHAPILRRSRGLTEVPDLDPLNQMVDLAFSIEARRQ
ncbi:hypothetical protein OHB26_16290 [Nocardia sp. NBC_01503]|uniref:hypothetical protein n=1 Tax=Nocardia sp. NBC_01503 TaxID=2975997 RepID=UPI002E7BBDC0|nr:hypothetical protein [Nocardia sp. NBC_01503]WTL35610.1 hypothetical protein OHB26_16290 [Nocardia sp. NBC_01503]